MKIYVLIGFLLLSFFGLQAQDPEEEVSGEVLEQIESLKVGMITKRLNLTSEQAIKFWPVYNEFGKERHQLRKQTMQLHRAFDVKSDAELKKDLYKLLELKQKEVDLEKKYFEKFQEVLTIRQVVALQKAERQFKKMLLEKLGKRGERKGKNWEDD